MKKTFLLLMALVAMTFFANAQTCDSARNLGATLHTPSWYDVNLQWDVPAALVQQSLSYCGNYVDGIGTNGNTDFIVAIRFEPSDLTALNGGLLNKVRFVPNEPITKCSYSIQVYVGGSALTPGTKVVDQPVPTITEQQWNEVVLTSPVTIDATQELWIAVRCNANSGYPAGCDGGPQVAGKGNLMCFEGQWQQLSDLDSTLSFNWAIEGVIITGSDRVSSYEVKRGTTVLGTTIANTYADLNAPVGTHTYSITANWNNSCTSAPISTTITMDADPCGTPISTFPYNCTFTEPEMQCWDILDANGDGKTFALVQQIFDMSAIAYTYHSTNNADDYIISPVFNLTGSQQLEFNYFLSDPLYPEKFSAYLFGENDTIQIIPTTTLPLQQTIELATVPLTQTGNYRVAIKCESDADNYKFYVTNFKVYESTAPRLDITPAMDTLTFATQLIGDTAMQQFLMVTANLTAPVVMTTAAPFYLTQDSVSFATTLTITPQSTNVERNNFTVAYIPTTEDTHTASFSATSDTMNVQMVFVGDAIDLGDPFIMSVTGDSSITTCDRYILDDGGYLENYAVNANYTLTIYPEEAGKAIRLQGTCIAEEDYDGLFIYNGIMADQNFLLGAFSSNDVVDIDVISTLGPLTIQFISDNSYSYDGFLLHATCEDAELQTLITVDNDTINFMPQETGDSAIAIVNVIAYNNEEEFEVTAPEGNVYVSADGETWGTTVTLPADGGELYILYTSEEAGSENAAIVVTNGDTTITVFVSGVSAVCDVVSTFPYQFGFDLDNPQLACWETVDVDGDLDEEDNGAFIFIRYNENNAGCAAYFQSTDASLTNANDWLISPEFALPAQSMRAKFDYHVYVMSFFGTEYPFPETYSVWVIPAGATYENAVNVVSERTVSNGAFHTQTVDLSAYSNQTIRVAIKVSSLLEESYYFVVDNFVVDTLPAPPVCDALTLPFTEDFEGDEESRACFINLDVDGDGYMWEIGSTPGYSTHGGVQCLISASYASVALTPNNYYITPQLIIPAEGATLSYWRATQDPMYPDEHYEVMISEGGSAPSDFTSIFEETLTSADSTYAEKQLDLSAYANKTIRIAFVHNESEDVFYMKIDDINVTSGTTGIADGNAENAVSIYPNPAHSILNVAADNFTNVEVLNFLGQVVYSSNVTDNFFQINVANLNAGIYFVRLSNENNIVTKKFVKE